ncbi:polyphosphate polymerase domain-containing protein [Bacillus sp. FJAT-50079]|uniref:polyphosphate polymerase domain-containing protein n=1 Tax=Bacillus sp. FJAT-50079 TaxID=2833577 RepID=UPI001BCA4672|nr:polyphosphate polymerase domain-containing protein [Bacillus sp. FJAT-50079]MBS4208017.1 polyphosphate polymerase domain-containing protein [Bacillus sp. FJAT-50079]
MPIEIFRRREQKYLITLDQYTELVKQLLPHMRPDRYGADGKYTVTSLYFESPDKKIYFETKNKYKFRQKLRLRIYDDTDINGTAFFEVKQKHKKVVNKRRLRMPLAEAYDYLFEKPRMSLDEYDTSNTQVLREIDHFKQLYELSPEMVVSYDRHALHHLDDPDLRITFDLNLRCRNNDLAIEHGPFGKNFIDPNLVVLEVKVSDSVPLWLTRILQDLQCEQRSASKFCTSLELLKSEELPSGITQEPILLGGV